MKNSVLFIGIALVTITNVCNASNLISIKSNSLAKINMSNTAEAFELNSKSNLLVNEIIESVNANKIYKTINEFIAEDNTITENNFSNETQVLDFEINKLDVFEVIESANFIKIEKTADQLIAEDNAITENNITNDTQVLDFNFINRNSIVEEVIETPTLLKIEKTADQLIAEDNLITENNISNEIIALDFEIINKKLILFTVKN